MTYKYILIFTCLLLLCCKQENSENVSQDITTTQAASLSKEGYTFIDLRTQNEIDESGMIDQAMHIDFRDKDFEKNVKQLPKDKKYILYCRSGGRSSKSLSVFKENGLEALNMLGGYNAWSKK